MGIQHLVSLFDFKNRNEEVVTADIAVVPRDRNDVEQIGLGLLGRRRLGAGQDENRPSIELQFVAQRKHAIAP